MKKSSSVNSNQRLFGQACVFFEYGELALALSMIQQICASESVKATGSPLELRCLQAIGIILCRQGKLKGALKHQHQVLAIQQKRPPDSGLAHTLHEIGIILCKQGDFKGSLEHFQKALAIQQTQVPDSLESAYTLNSIGNVLRDQGDLKGALKHYQQALAIKQAKDPRSVDVASTLGNIGIVVYKEGDLKGALEYHQKALAIHQVQMPHSLAVAGNLGNISNVLVKQGDLKGALEHFQKALAIQKKRAPGSLIVAETLGNIGNVCSKQGDFKDALEHYRQALTCAKNVKSNCHEVSELHVRIARLLWRMDDRRADACAELRSALALDQEPGPADLSTYNFFDFIGHTKLLLLLTEYELTLGHSLRTIIERYQKEARQACTNKQYKVALLYLRQATHLAHARDPTSVPVLLTEQADLQARLRCPCRAWFLRQRAGTALVSGTAPRQSRLHQDLEELRCSYNDLLCDYHLSLAQHGELTARDENHTGDFFVGLLNLLDKVYVHWVHAVLRSKGQGNLGQHFFPAHGSKDALENASRDGNYWAVVHEKMFESDKAGNAFVSLTLKDGLLKAGYLDRNKKWTTAAVAAVPDFGGLPPTHAGFLSDLQAMQGRITADSRPEQSDLRRLIQPIQPLKAARWMELLSSTGVCDVPKPNSDGKLYASLDTQPVTTRDSMLLLKDLLGNTKGSVEERAIRCFYPQVEQRLQQAAHGINAPDHSAAFEAFLATQPYPYYQRDTTFTGQQWGDRVKILANANKHLKLTTQNVIEKLEQATHGSFRRMGTQILLEMPERDVFSWSFVGVGGLDKAQSWVLARLLRDKALIHKRRVFHFNGPTHPIMQRVVHAAAREEDGSAPRQELVRLLTSLTTSPLQTEEDAAAVADFLIEKAKLSAFLQIESTSRLSVCSLVEKAMGDTLKWLDAVHQVSPILNSTVPKPLPYSARTLPLTTLEQHQEAYRTRREEYLSSPPFGGDAEWVTHRLAVVKEVEWRVHDLQNALQVSLAHAQPLLQLYQQYELYDACRQLDKVYDVTAIQKQVQRQHSHSNRDTRRQLEHCQLILWEIARHHPEHGLASEGAVRTRCTELLVKLQGVIEQVLDRVAHRLVGWPNKKFPEGRLKGLHAACSEKHYIDQMRRLHLIGPTPSGVQPTPTQIDLRVHYPSVWSALREMQPYWYYQHDRGDDSWWTKLTALIGTAKHGQSLDISWSDSTGLQVRQFVDRWQRSSFTSCFHPGNTADALQASCDFYEHQKRKGVLRKDDTMRPNVDVLNILRKAPAFVRSMQAPASTTMQLLLHADADTQEYQQPWKNRPATVPAELADALRILFPRKLGSRSVQDLQTSTVLKLFRKWVQLFHFGTGLTAPQPQHPIAFVPFATRILRCVRRFVNACDLARQRTHTLFEAAQSGGDLSAFLPSSMLSPVPLDRADMAGNTPLHWACRLGNVSQVETLTQDPESFNRACRPNHDGETPLMLAATVDCATLVRRHAWSVLPDTLLEVALLQAGATALIQNLKAQQYNGLRCNVKKYDQSRQRYLVQLQRDGKQLYLKVENLR